MTEVISGFPGVGKSTLAKLSGKSVLDLDSSAYSKFNTHNGEGRAVTVRHPLFPKNYMQAIKENIGKFDYILVSSHDDVREALRDANIQYRLVYPDRRCKQEYCLRYEERRTPWEVMHVITLRWDSFIDSIEEETFPRLVKLTEGQYLADIINEEEL